MRKERAPFFFIPFAVREFPPPGPQLDHRKPGFTPMCRETVFTYAGISFVLSADGLRTTILDIDGVPRIGF